MYTRLMFVPPEFATSSVSERLLTTIPHGSDPTGMLVDAKPLPPTEVCQTSSALNDVADTKTCPRAPSTTMSPILPECGSGYVRPYTSSVESTSALARLPSEL